MGWMIGPVQVIEFSGFWPLEGDFLANRALRNRTPWPDHRLFLTERAVERLHQRADQIIQRRTLDGRKHDRGRHAGVKSDVRQSLRSEEHTSELQSRGHLVCRLLLE